MGEYDRVEWRDSGQYVTRRQEQALEASQHEMRKRYRSFLWQMPQGSWRPQTSYSGTTHTNAGVCDVWFEGISYRNEQARTKFTRALSALKGVGAQAAFGRGPWDAMVLHFHVVDLDTHHMDSNAVWQASEYRNGNNGLSGGVNDKFPWRPSPIHAWRYR